jgi:integrase
LRALADFWRARHPEQPLFTVGDWLAGGPDLVAGYLHSRQDLSPATRNKHLRHLSAVWNELVRRKLVNDKLGLEKEDELLREPRAWLPEEFDRLLAQTAELRGRIGDVPKSAWWLALLLLDYNIGVRISALMSIQTRDLDLQAGTVMVRAEAQKDRSDQEFTLLPQSIDALRRIRPERLERVFEEWPYDRARSTKEHRRNGYRTLTEHLRRLLAAAALPETSKDLWHKMRRTFVTEIARQAGVPTAQAMAGHSHQSVTARYLDKRRLELPSAAALLRQPTAPVQMRLFIPTDDAKVG